MGAFFRSPLGLLLQLAVTIAIIVSVPHTLVQAILLLLWWGFTFWPLSAREWILVLIASLGYIGADIAVTSRGVFTFATQDAWGLPYYEFFVWGFFFLHASRMCKAEFPRRWIPGVLYAAFVVLCASIFSSSTITLVALAAAVFLGFVLFHRTADFRFAGYFVLLGVVVEFIGTATGEWSYHIQFPVLWWILTWAASGLILHRAALPVSARLARYFERRE